MKLIIGLGNPGAKYEHTRHNVGKNTVFELAKRLNLSFSLKKSLGAYIAQIGQGSGATLLAYPDSYMNLSGFSIQKLVNFYKIPPANLYVIHDDLDLGVGEWKLQFNRGPAGHHGVESTIEQLGTQEFWRYRIGIGRNPTIPVESYVLQPFSPTEKEIIYANIDKIISELSINILNGHHS
ncbi:MAG: aminoacyl-tRNA hydrolase [Candidatus Shapirobacteria bacterium]